MTLTLASAVLTAETVTVSYTAEANPLQDSSGNNTANLPYQAVTNSTP